MQHDVKSPILKDLEGTQEGRMALQRQELFLEVVEGIQQVMAAKGMTQSELASLLGKKPPQISRWLNGTCNMTLSTLSDILFVLEYKPQFQAVPHSRRLSHSLDRAKRHRRSA